MDEPETPSAPRRWVMPAVAVALVAAIAASLLQPDEQQTTAAPVAPPAADAQPWQLALLSLADPQAAPAAPPPARDEVQLCDYGRVQLDRGRLPASLVDAARRSLTGLTDRMAASGSAVERARAFYMRMHADEQRAVEQTITSVPGCAEDEACRNRAYVRRGAGDAWTTELARLASSTADPHAYALAFYACRGHVGELAPPACATVTAARWAQLDADNAMAWLYVAAEAEARTDPVLRDEALQRLANARRSNAHWDGWFDLTQSAAMVEQPRSTQAAVLDELTRLNFAMPVPPYPLVLQYCSRERVTDSSRRHTCADIATLLTERDGSLLAHRVGTALGARTGWSTERLVALREEFEASRAVVQSIVNAEQRYSCSRQAELAEWLREVASGGELAAARRRLQASGRSPADWIAQGRAAIVRAADSAREPMLSTAQAADAVPLGSQ